MRQIIYCFFFTFLLSLTPFGVVSDFEVCPDSAGHFRRNSSFDVNRRRLLSSLASNVTSRGGFFNASVGEGPNRVYGAGLCIPGTEPEVCSECIETESETMVRNCPNQTEGFAWPGDRTLCLVRYSVRSFHGSLDLEPNLKLYNSGNLTGNSTEFDGIWEALMLRMIAVASSSMAEDQKNTSSSSKRYAVDEATFDQGLQTLYAFMQCTPDLSPGDCHTCLRTSVADYESCCHGHQGGAIVRPSCFFRWDLYPFFKVFDNITLAPPRSPPTPSPGGQANATKTDGKKISTGTIVAIVVPVAVIFLVLLAVGVAVCRRRKSYKAVELEKSEDTITEDSLQLDFKTIEAATDEFSESNKLGQGGFGVVYKGTLPDGTEVAVKRLSETSGQGAEEFKNEAVLVAKLQHRNLVRLLGFCVEREEKILIYEFVPNKSLDHFLFDPENQGRLDWTRRYKIIGGIARGILYLHHDSRLTIIHRDLKASNILLDADMNPKISDFGLARIFGVDQTQGDTSRIIGTYGYMPPEYVMHGRFSMKSDVYSLGVLILEIISGKKNSSFYETDGTNDLPTHAWRLWRNGSPLQLLNPCVGENYQGDEVIRSIHIGLLCVQEDPADRPTMGTIVLMLTSNTVTLPVPKEPGFAFQSSQGQDPLSRELVSDKCTAWSVDDASITDVHPR